ncbi:MAG TPA: NapC/NirT family cytochrome c [Actinomycetota bacterium]|nr:NapC/NirT family cytochrome c [Actinomycetota bacterium]
MDRDDRPEDRDPRRRSVVFRVLLAVGGVVVLVLLLVGWNRMASSDAFCSSCHEMEVAAASAERSVHDDLPCLACHGRPGLLGAIRYVPTLARETLHSFSGWQVAHDVLRARDCGSCHQAIDASPELAAAHEPGADCASCHGDVAHPPLRLAGFERPVEEVGEDSAHPEHFVQTHGEEVAASPSTCVDCHDAKFCESCHFRSTYPHPDGWIEQHGSEQIAGGADACTLCHPQTFCAGCHGTEIPHDARWLGEHWRDLQDASPKPCMLCHPKTDCADCHARHGVHREQDLYE